MNKTATTTESTELKLVMLGMIEGNGHPSSWSGTTNGFNPDEMAKCPYAGIPVYMGKQPLESVRIPAARVTHIWSDDPVDAPKVAAASLTELVIKAEEVTGWVDAVVIATDDGTDHARRERPFSKRACQCSSTKPWRRRCRSCGSLCNGTARAGASFSPAA